MTVALILNIVLSTAVFAGVVGLLVWSIASADRSLAGADAQIRKPGELKLSRAPLAHPAPVRASGRRRAGVKRLGPSRASIASSIEPALTAAFAFPAFGERFGPIQMLGAGRHRHAPARSAPVRIPPPPDNTSHRPAPATRDAQASRHTRQRRRLSIRTH
jgi:hypothetical protein